MIQHDNKWLKYKGALNFNRLHINTVVCFWHTRRTFIAIHVR